ncbi:M15 family metallopeptidase [Simiduia sp. 21SJ11W-1]|uniref:M15 family metallopeptidase n=1 Tax=Simiduia sp. 21SJ11W-1 TaxID=2909669 RepID=UPI00209F3CD2|nr:M15 family metallopeptidase [Simiduia sp. 21SJ11W-1]UTA49157.1 M15 family metallopeptidase [Simiduia sp. 21SJ11W-1]
MKRRDLLTGLFAASTFALGNGLLWKHAQNIYSPRTASDPLVTGDISDSESVRALAEAESAAVQPQAPLAKPQTLTASAPAERTAAATEAAVEVPQVRPVEAEVAATEDRILEKVRNFEQEFADDIYLSDQERIVMLSVLARMERAEAFIGHGNYNISSFDYLIKVARRFPQVGEFTPVELDFVERIFFADARRYGFMGEKVISDLTAAIPDNDIFKVPYSGQFIYRGQSEQYYQKLKRDIGDSIILTSGIRSNVKQMHLFLAKAAVSNFNLSKASRSLAPPGHSFHGVGDFDVGKVGWGIANFSDKFAQTDEFKRMQDLGYVQIRYTENNRLGVRFEPWHIKVV